MIGIKNKISTSSLTSGVLILLLSNLIVKIVGVMFKIPLVGIMGDEGMGYFNSAYTVYTLFYTVSSAGLPVALSILISKRESEGKQKEKAEVYRVALGLFAALGGVFAIVMSVCSGVLAKAIGNTGAAPSILAISPVMLFVCITSAVRGYFQGHQNMIPTAASQLVEALGKLAFGICFALLSVKKGYSYPVVAAYSILGITVSEALSMICILLFPKRMKRGGVDKCNLKKRRSIVGDIVRIALPITMSSAVVSLSGLLDLSLVMNRLTDIGYTEAQANALFGNYTGLAQPLFNLPASLITPIALGIVPYITSALSVKEMSLARSTVKSSVKSTLIIAFPCAFGMSALALPILQLIFDDAQALRAEENLSVLALATIGVALTTVTGAILQSYGHVVFPIVSMAAGCTFKLISGYYLIGMLGMVGTPISTLLCYGVTALMNLGYIYLKIGKPVDFLSGVIKPLVCSLVCAFGGYVCYGLISERLDSNGVCCILSIMAAGILYLMLAVIFKLIAPEDTKVFPGGKYIEKIMIGRRVGK